MYNTRASTICRLCLCSDHHLVDMFEEGSSAGFDVKNAIEELLRVEVVKEALYPWRVCSGCLEKLTEFNYFKRRCIENQEVYDKGVKKLNFAQGRNECDKQVKSEEDEGPEETPYEVACWDCGHLEGYQPQTGVDGNDTEGDGDHFRETVSLVSGDSLCRFGGDGSPCASWAKEGILDVGGPHSPGGVSLHGTWTKQESMQQASLFTGQQGAIPGGIDPWILHSRQRASADSTSLVTSVWGEKGAPDGTGASRQEVDEENADVKFGTRLMDGITSPISPREEAENSEAVTLLKSEPSDNQMMGRRRENNSETMKPTDEANGRLGVEGHGTIKKLVMSVESSSGKGYGCDLCGCTFRSKYLMVKHVGVHSVTGVFKCRTCDVHFEDNGKHQRHSCFQGEFETSVRHNSEVGLPDSVNAFESNANVDGCTHIVHKKHSCKKCPSSFPTKNQLRVHMSTHSKERRYGCSTCLKLFTSKPYLKRHLLTHSPGSPLSCGVCGKPFSVRSKLVKHKAQHNGKKPYVCKMCPKAFAHPSLLKHHIRTHTGEKPFSCTQCGRAFAEKGHLKGNMVTHDDSKPFSCSQCSKSFSRQSYLKVHMSFHAGFNSSRLKSHSCRLCSKSFYSQSKLTRHMVVHTGDKPHSCTVCSKSFGLRSHLKVHLRTHSSEKPYSCSVCSHSFKLKHNLTQHMLVHQRGNRQCSRPSRIIESV